MSNNLKISEEEALNALKENDFNKAIEIYYKLFKQDTEISTKCLATASYAMWLRIKKECGSAGDVTIMAFMNVNWESASELFITSLFRLKNENPPVTSEKSEKIFKIVTYIESILKFITYDLKSNSALNIYVSFLLGMGKYDECEKLIKNSLIDETISEGMKQKISKFLPTIEDHNNASKLASQHVKGFGPDYLLFVNEENLDNQLKEIENIYNELHKNNVDNSVSFDNNDKNIIGTNFNPQLKEKIDSIVNRYLVNVNAFKGYEPIYQAVKREIVNEDELIQCLKHGNLFIIAAAAESLGSIKSKKAVMPLINDVIKKESNLISWELALEKSINSLAEIGDEQAIEPLNELANKYDDEGVKSSALKAIKSLKGETSKTETSSSKEFENSKSIESKNKGCSVLLGLIVVLTATISFFIL